MITLHHLNDSRSQRILWLLEELGVPYEIKIYQRGPHRRAPKELAEIHPLGTSPVITDDSVTLGESGAIIEYLISKYGNGRFQAPASGQGYLDNLYFTHYGEGSLMPLRMHKLWYEVALEQMNFLIWPIACYVVQKGMKERLLIPGFRKHFEFVEKHLEKSKTGWFAGGLEPTAADFQMVFPLEASLSTVRDICGTPKIVEYVKRVYSRPAYQRALEKGGPYKFRLD